MVGLTLHRIPAVLLAASLVAAAAVLPVPTTAADDCPPAPSTLAGLIAVDTGAVHPLSEAYGRYVWAYPERAAECFGARELDLIVFVGGPEGIGGTMAFKVEPSWLIEERFVAVDDSTTDPAAPNRFFPLAVPPRLDDAFAARSGTWARITGHFDDPAAESCRVVHGDPPDAPSTAVAVDICRTAFVLTSIRGPDDPPVTDTTSDVATPASAVRVPMWGWALLAVVAGIASAWHLGRRHR